MRIFLNTGREISLVRLHQSLTYYGVLCGLPYRESNARKVREVLDAARKFGPEGLTPRLIPPVITPIALPPRPPAAIQKVLEKTGMTAEEYAAMEKGSNYERLPNVTCIGVFDSKGLNMPDSEPYSSMAIVWFQDKFALPIDEGVLSQIRRRDWDAQAKDWIW